MIIGPTQNATAGIYKPASDVTVVWGKLYVGEEDSDLGPQRPYLAKIHQAA